ncbi:MAG TPA: helix-turn-helix domain-containing protein [Mycobacterium sp.]|nr:helix-turn-helix domain-containing protein [Mycobacterium sp.]
MGREDTMDELVVRDEIPRDRLNGFRRNTHPLTDAERLAAERTALRQVAMLVADRADPAEVFGAATIGLGRSVQAAKAGLWRFETSGEITTVAGAAEPAKLKTWPVGSRQPVAGSHLVARVQDSGRPVRLDSYDNVAPSVAARVGREGIYAAVAVPVVVDGCVWGMAAVGSVQPGPMPADTEARIAGFAELIASAVTAGKHAERERQSIDATSRRLVLMDAVLQGRILDDWSVWEAANHLRLPSQGPYAVVAAGLPAIGTAALPDIDSKLRSLDVYSAWRMLPDLQVGIIHVKSDQQLDKILALMTRATTTRVGVSSRFDDLRDTSQALHIAKVMMRGRTDNGSKIAVFDGSILATAAVSAPAVMVKSVSNVFSGFDDLGEEERELLFETFRVWQENDASMNTTAEALICHPNTVRARLRRIEQRTGRSLSRPRDVAELCLAFEVRRRLM